VVSEGAAPGSCDLLKKVDQNFKKESVLWLKTEVCKSLYDRKVLS
jgi:hypothetical protein